jgi:hypothetical protein
LAFFHIELENGSGYAKVDAFAKNKNPKKPFLTERTEKTESMHNIGITSPDSGEQRERTREAFRVFARWSQLAIRSGSAADRQYRTSDTKPDARPCVLSTPPHEGQRGRKTIEHPDRRRQRQ